MNTDSSRVPSDAEPKPATSHGLPFVTALVLSILCGLVMAGGSVAVLRSSLSNPAKAALSIVTLVALLGFAYSIIQLILAVIATAGERRWFVRHVGERRQGDRARKP